MTIASRDESVGMFISVYEHDHEVFIAELTGVLMIGRAEPTDPHPFRITGTSPPKLVIVPKEQKSVSRQHVQLEPTSACRIKVTNLSRIRPIGLPSGDLLACGKSREFETPFELRLDGKVVRLDVRSLDQSLVTLDHLTIAPGDQFKECPDALSDLLEPNLRLSDGSRNIKVRDLMSWLRRMTAVFHDAIRSHDFFIEAAKAAANIVRLDSAAALRWDGKDWKVEAYHIVDDPSFDGTYHASQTLLERMRAETRTCRQTPTAGLAALDNPRSLMSGNAAVAAPILNRDRDVIGALYGERHGGSGSGGRTDVSELDAVLVEMLATGVAAGIARLDQEQAALQARVTFEQFFSPTLAERLESQRDLLIGREAEVTVLFCDIRNFSRISHVNGPRQTVEWISGVMDVLSQCVTDHDGVLVDYVGDEVMAMWGAPDDRPNHAELACLAALQMLKLLPVINEKWQKQINSPTSIGIGINSGVAYVGNTGSQRKFKYGPLGNTVNLASRVQGVTKHIGIQLLATGSSIAMMGGKFSARHLCKVNVWNIDEPVQLYELVDNPTDEWRDLKRQYESALAAFENSDFRLAVYELGKLLKQHPADGPAMHLLSRSVNAMINGLSADHPTWVFSEK